jgi:hypothetical protein
MWPFKRKHGPEREERSAFPGVTGAYIDAKRREVSSDGSAALSATLAACVGMWGRGMAMLEPDVTGTLTAPVLDAIGRDLIMRGESVWHIRLEGGEAVLKRVAYHDLVAPGRYHLTIARPNDTETVRALAGEVLHLIVNPDPVAPWQGRSPFRLMGASPGLMADIEGALSGATEWTAKGILPMPEQVPQEQQEAALRGLKAGGRLAAIRSKAEFATNTGQARGLEWKRVDLTPNLKDADLNDATDSLHERLLAASGVPPALITSSGAASSMREAYRLFVLTTIEPMARTLLPELSKIGVSKLSTASMMSADVAGRARAVGILTGAGMPLEQALAKVGWNDA